jgi:hypothetical protein
MGGSIATAVYTAIINNTFAEKLPEKITDAISGLNFPSSKIPDLIAAAASGSADAYEAIPGITKSVIEAAGLGTQLAYVDAFKM